MEKVALVACESYDPQKVREALSRSFSFLGGLDRYIKPGMKVLLKVNLVLKKPPSEAATTHPAVVEALCREIKTLGAIPLVGDSPGGPFSPMLLKSTYHVCGMTEAAQAGGGELCLSTGSRVVSLPDAKMLKQVEVTDMVLDADCVISVGKLKTHGLTAYTGVVKNLFGIVPGVSKAEYHFRLPQLFEFSNMLVDLCDFVKPVLSVLDAVIAMEGEGPTGGDPRHVGALLVSQSPYALDTVGCSLIGLDPLEVCTVARAAERGLFSGKLSDIDLAGDPLKDLQVPDFRKLQAKGNMDLLFRFPKVVKKIASAVLLQRPVFVHKKCIGCGICVRSCPAKTIALNQHKRPVVDLSKCIRCFCCQELCPERAVNVHRPWLNRFIK